jgi:hypothetical protein
MHWAGKSRLDGQGRRDHQRCQRRIIDNLRGARASALPKRLTRRCDGSSSGR